MQDRGKSRQNSGPKKLGEGRQRPAACKTWCSKLKSVGSLGGEAVGKGARWETKVGRKDEWEGLMGRGGKKWTQAEKEGK